MRADSDMRPGYMRGGFYVGEIRVYKGHNLLYTEKDIPLKAVLYTAKLVLKPNPDMPDCIQDFTIHLDVMYAPDSTTPPRVYSYTQWRRWNFESGTEAYQGFIRYIQDMVAHNETLYTKASEGG